MTFDEIKKKDVKGQIEWLRTQGVEVPPDKASIEEVLQRCASVFLNKKAAVDPNMPKIAPDLTPAIPKEFSPRELPVVDKELSKPSKSVARRVKAQVEAKATLPPGQDFPRCGYCSKALTDKSQIFAQSKTEKPVCTECAAKFPSKLKTKEGTEMPKAKSHKKQEVKVGTKKTAKKTVSTKTGRKGNVEALKKAREAKLKARGGETIQSFCVRQIKERKDATNAEIAEAAAKKFGSKTSAASVAWYRNRIHSGEIK